MMRRIDSKMDETRDTNWTWDSLTAMKGTGATGRISGTAAKVKELQRLGSTAGMGGSKDDDAADGGVRWKSPSPASGGPASRKSAPSFAQKPGGLLTKNSIVKPPSKYAIFDSDGEDVDID